MEIKKAEFTLSAPMVSMCPNDTKPEYAFIGRSNVGKSSLINMLCRNKKLGRAVNGALPDFPLNYQRCFFPKNHATKGKQNG